MRKNSENPSAGKAFQYKVQAKAQENFGKLFIQECPVLIGNPPKEHRFDLVSEDHLIIIECKSYTWTKSWNVPSAKLAALDEAILYMRCIIPSCSARKIIIMERSFNKKTCETLAEYFVRRKGHLLADIEVMELDEGGFLRLLTC
jgi:hypothetical protein